MVHDRNLVSIFDTQDLYVCSIFLILYRDSLRLYLLHLEHTVCMTYMGSYLLKEG